MPDEGENQPAASHPRLCEATRKAASDQSISGQATSMRRMPRLPERLRSVRIRGKAGIGLILMLLSPRPCPELVVIFGNPHISAVNRTQLAGSQAGNDALVAPLLIPESLRRKLLDSGARPWRELHKGLRGEL